MLKMSTQIYLKRDRADVQVKAQLVVSIESVLMQCPLNLFLLYTRGEQILIFQLLIHIRKNFCTSISNPYPKISEI